MVLLFAVPLLTAVLFWGIGLVLPRIRKSVPKLTAGEQFLPFLAAIIQCIAYLLVWLICGLFTVGEGFAIPASANVLCCLITDAALMLPRWSENRKLRHIAKRMFVLCIALFAAEIFLFNAKSLTLHPQEQSVPMTIDYGNASYSEEGFFSLYHGAALSAHDLPDWTRCVTLHIEQDYELLQSPIRVRALMTDDNFHENYQPVGQKLTSGYGRDIAFSILPYGDLRSLRFEFLDIVYPARLYTVTCMSAMPFSFSAWRFCGLLLLALAVFIIRESGLTRIVYDRRKLSHSLLVYAMVCLCTMSVLIFWVPDQQLISYPEDFAVETASPYEQTLDAFESGHAWLNVEPDPALLESDIRFDRPLRDESGLPALFDRALYNGKYYSYFGIAPVVTFYYPVYWLTGSLPTLDMACMFYAPFTALLMCLTLLAAVRLFCRQPNLLLLLLSLPVSVGLCGVYYSLQFPNQYDVVVASGLCFLMLTLWSGFQACLTKIAWKRCVLLAVCGIACVMCVQSRPSMAITAVILAPCFLGILRDRTASARRRAGSAASFCVPVLIGAAATMYYNMIRFSSPLDFGAGYQLTVSNVQANRLRLSALPAALYHYFLQPVGIKQCFPFVTLSYTPLENYHMYSNLEHTIGMLAFPMLLLAMLLLPKALRSPHRIGSEGTALQGKAVVVCSLVMAVLVAWLNFCLGGVSLRYAFDFMPVFLIAVTVILLSAVTDPGRYVYKIALLCICLTFVLFWLLNVQSYVEGARESVIMVQHPTLTEELADAILFWE